MTGEAKLAAVAETLRFFRRIFLAPPWPEIYVTDAERKHDFDAAVAGYERLLEVYLLLGYEAMILPKISVSVRAQFVLDSLL